MRVAISGASGLVGSPLVQSLRAAGHKVVRLVRPVSSGNAKQFLAVDDTLQWSPNSGLAEPERLHGIDAIIHLAGRSIATQRWTEAEKRRIRDSRVDATQRLVEQIVALESPPRAFVSASAIGIYGDRGDERLDESSRLDDGFLADVAQQWEQASQPLAGRGIRLVHARLGIVMSSRGGALGKVLPLFRFGLGGRVGNGKQYWSWIALEDCIRGLQKCVEDNSMHGVYNLVAPQPVTNGEFTASLAAALHRPAVFPVPAWLLRTVLGEMADGLLLASCWVEPRRLLEAGFEFRYPELNRFLQAEFATPST